MGNIIITNDGCQLDGTDSYHILNRIDEELSFKVQGAHFMRIPGWDGTKRILSKDLKFPYGLLERVKNIYNRYDQPLNIVDKRIKTKSDYSIDIFPRLFEMGKTPYPYQIEAADKVAEYDCGVYRMATGSGKTITMAIMAAKLGKQTNIYVIGTDLLHQTYKLFKSIFGEKHVGIVGDSLCEISDINIISIWTAGCALGLKKNKIIFDEVVSEKEMSEDKYRKIINLLSSAKVHILDECHIAACDTIQAISKKIKPDNIYGMSASPWRDDNQDLIIEGILGKRIVEVSASFLIKNSFLVRPIIRFKEVPKVKDPEKTYPAIYSQYIVENEIRNNLVLDATKSLVQKGYQTLVLYKTINHGKTLNNIISKEMKCHILSGSDSSDVRNKVKEDLENKKIDCVIASSIFDIGVDIPSLSGLIIAGSGKSSVRALQRIGRVIRKYPNKKHAAIVDFNDNIKYLKDHSKRRRQIYSLEEEFDVK